MVTEKGDGARTMKASEFRAKCLALMDEIAESGEEIIITKRGKAVARLVPYEEKSASWFGRGGDGIVMHDDLIEPVDVEWEAETNPDRVLNP